MATNDKMVKTLLTLGLGLILGFSLTYFVFNYKNSHSVKEKNHDIFFDTENTTFLFPSDSIKEDSLLAKLAEDSRYCWDTIKLINGEVLTGSFANDFDGWGLLL